MAVATETTPRAPAQLSLFPTPPAAAVDDDRRTDETTEHLAARLATMVGRPIASLVLTDNRRRIFSARPGRAGLAVRLHRCVVGAAPDLLPEVATLIVAPPRSAARARALHRLRQRFERHGPEVAPGSRPTRTVGVALDLAVLRDEIDARYFGATLGEVAITWGRGGPRGRCKAARSIRLGSYDHHAKLIRIHPALDRFEVPRYVVAAVVHHELLHAAIPPEPGRGLRRRVHPPAFRRRERAYPDHRRAERWIAANLDALLRGRRPRSGER